MYEVKFRGKTRDGKIIYSDSIKFEEIDGADVSFPYLFDKENDEWIEILPDSLAQLIAYDEDGTEVYSDDALSDSDVTCYPKIFIELEVEDGGTDTYDFGDKFIGRTVKES